MAQVWHTLVPWGLVQPILPCRSMFCIGFYGWCHVHDIMRGRSMKSEGHSLIYPIKCPTFTLSSFSMEGCSSIFLNSVPITQHFSPLLLCSSGMVLMGQWGPAEETGKWSSYTTVQMAGFWRNSPRIKLPVHALFSDLPHLLRAVASTIPRILDNLIK